MEQTENEATMNNEFKYKGIKAMPFVIGNETFEKLGTIGSSLNLLVYLTSIFNLKAITAANIVNIFNGTCNFGTLAGAFLSDTYSGRYKTLGFASVASFLGMLVLTLTAAIPKLHPPLCGNEETGRCTGATPWQMAFLLSAFGLLVIGASGIRPCNLAFGADQFDPNTESGRRGTTSFFNWYYFTYTFAAMVSMTIIVYVQSNVSWSLGLAIPAILMFLSCVLFFAGTKIYVKLIPRGSPLTGIAQVIVAAIRKRKLELSEQQAWFCLLDHVPKNSINMRLAHTDQFRFLNKAAVITPQDQINSDGSAANPWRLSSIQQVEEVKCILRIMPIWAAGVIYYVSVVQGRNYVVFQALQCNRHLGTKNFQIPAASYVIFAMLSITVWLPIYDRIIVPWFRRLTGKEDGITLLQKIGVGIIVSVFAMVISGLVEDRRKMLAVAKPSMGAISSMSGMLLIPQIALIGLSEAFALIGQLELFYKQFPENMRSIASALLFVGLSGSSYLSSFIASVVHRTTKWLEDDLNHGKLNYFYFLIAALEFLNLGYFLVCARWYKYKGTSSKPGASATIEINQKNQSEKLPV